MRHIRFGDQMNMRRNFVQRGTQELNHVMCLWQMNAGRADLLPQIGNRIETDKGCAALDVREAVCREFQAGLRDF